MTEEQEIQSNVAALKKEIREALTYHNIAVIMQCVPTKAKYLKTVEYFTWIDAELKKPIEEIDLDGIDRRLEELDKME